MDFNALACVRLSPGAIAEVVISRPKALNALNRQVINELEAVFLHLRDDAALRCVIVTGEGNKAFVAGADIAEMAKLTAAEAEAFATHGQSVFTLIEQCPVPVLAAVNGFALGGGCELALACDLIYAADHAKFGQPEVKLGLMPGFGGTVRLSRKIGQAAASEWIFTGEMVSAESAREQGLVRAVYPSDELLPRVRELAGVIAKRAPLAVRACKRMMVQDAPVATAMGMERWSFGALFRSADVREGTGAFVDKREPVFKGA